MDGPVRLVRQEDPWGCMIASLAMVTGQTYEQVKGDLDPWLYSPQGERAGGIGETEAEGYLTERGFAWGKRHRHLHVATCEREVWPPAPWADRHLCTVAALSNNAPHAVVMLGDGRVLDPWHGEVESLAKYPTVFTVLGVYRVREPLPDAILNHDSPGRAKPRICMCEAAWKPAA